MEALKRRSHRLTKRDSVDIRNLLSKTNPEEVSESRKQGEVDFDQLMNFLKKRAKERTVREVQIISKFLEKSEISCELKIEDDLNSLSLLLFCAMYMEYEFIKKDEIIPNTDDLYYLIVTGEVSLLKSENESEVLLRAGQLFGAEENNTKQNFPHSVKATRDTHFLTLDKKAYKEHVETEKLEHRAKDLLFLNENFFFSTIGKTAFEHKYFDSFVLEEYCRGYRLFREGDPVKEIIIIKEGTVELTINKNFMELHNVITQLLQQNEFLNSKFHNQNEYESKNKTRNFMQMLTKKKNLTLFKLNSREVLGALEVCFEFLHLNTATVTSNKAKIYRLDLNTLKRILEDEKACEAAFKQFSMSKINSIMERFIHVRNSTLKIYDKDFTRVNNHFLEMNGSNKEESEPAKKIIVNDQKVKKKNRTSALRSNMNLDFSIESKGKDFEMQNTAAENKYKDSILKSNIRSINSVKELQHHFHANSSEDNTIDFNILHKPKILIADDNQIKQLKKDWTNLQKNIEYSRKYTRGSSIEFDNPDKSIPNNNKSSTNDSLFLTEKPLVSVSYNPPASLTSSRHQTLSEYSLVNLLPDITKYTSPQLPSNNLSNNFKKFLTDDKAKVFKGKYASPLLNKLDRMMKSKSKHGPLVEDFDLDEEDNNYLNPRKSSTIATVKEFYLNIKMGGYKGKQKLGHRVSLIKS